MLHVYTHENKVCGCFDPWVFSPEDFETYKLHLHNFALMFPEIATDIKHNFQYLKVHYVGTFDELTGIVSYSQDKLMFDLGADVEQLQALRKQVQDGSKTN